MVTISKKQFFILFHIVNTFFPFPRYFAGIFSLRPQTARQAQPVCSEELEKILPAYSWQENRYTRSCGGNSDSPRGKHTVGDYARFHQHLHALVADGLFLESGYFFIMPKTDLRPLREDIVASDDTIINVRAYKLRRIPQLMWRECINKVRSLRLSGRSIH